MTITPSTRPPQANRLEHEIRVHGDVISDPWSWLRDKESPDLRAYLDAENEYTDSVMKKSEPLRHRLYDEMLSRIRETDLSVPARFGRHEYYSRTEKGLQYTIYCRRRIEPDSPEEVILDLNQIAEGHEYLGLGMLEVSADESLLAFSTDFSGFRQYTLRIKNLSTGALLDDCVELTADAVWDLAGRSLYYTMEDKAKRPWRLLRHRLGTTNDEILYEESDESYYLGLGISRDRRMAFATSASSTTSEVRTLRLDEPEPIPQLVQAREEGHEYYVDHHDGVLYIRTNDRGRNFRLVTAPSSTPWREEWNEVIAHSDDVMIEEADLFERYLVVWERCKGHERLRVRDLVTTEEHFVEFPDAAYAILPETNDMPSTRRFRFNYQSFITPPSVIEYDMETRERTLLKQTEILGDWDGTQYVTERIEAISSDGTSIPISLVYRRDLVRNGGNPLVLYGYGSYGISIDVNFSSERFSLIDRGVVFAVAHIRGGGELGKAWHERGRMQEKKNTFTDFIAAAEHLIVQGYTSNTNLVIEGASAGGLLVGAVMNMRPDLFRAVIARVPFVDITNTMLDATLPLTVGEYLEWGNPNTEAEYRYIRSYDPYLNLEARDYPMMLVKTSWNDSQVMVWEAAKYVAKQRSLRTDDNTLLLHTNLGAGHGGASGRYERLEELAFDYSFILNALGVEPRGA